MQGEAARKEEEEEEEEEGGSRPPSWGPPQRGRDASARNRPGQNSESASGPGSGTGSGQSGISFRGSRADPEAVQRELPATENPRKSRRLRKSRKSASGSRPPVTPGSSRTEPNRDEQDRAGAARPASGPGVGSFRARCGPAVAHGRKRVSDSPRTRKAASSTTDRRPRTGPCFRFFQPPNALATALPQSPDLLL